MTLADLLTRLRTDFLDDTGGDVVTSWTTDDEDCLWSNAELVRHLDAAQNEFCERLAIRDASTPAVVDITLVDGTAKYALHASIISVEEVTLASTGAPVCKLYEEERAAMYQTVNDLDDVKYYQEDIDARSLRIWATPSAADTLNMVVLRRPINAMVWSDWATAGSTTPEIDAHFHESLLYWAAHLALLKADSDTRDMEMSGRYQGKFTQIVGPRRTAQEQHIRKQAANRAHRTVATYY